MNFVRIRRALISVSDKTGLIGFAQSLVKHGVSIVSTGGTLDALTSAGISAVSVSDVTGFPEILDGRVKTLHPKIHAGILAVTANPAHVRQLHEHDVESIDLIVVNLYPFEQTVARTGVTMSETIEQIDIGGPAMIRAAAKNYNHKVVVVDPAQYNIIEQEMTENDGSVSESMRFALARAAFQRTAQYDTAIGAYLSGGTAPKVAQPAPPPKKTAESGAEFPGTFFVNLPKAQDLRYGENPHQHAALYGGFAEYCETLHGKELSYNNIVDIQAAAELCEEFIDSAAVIVKHTNPCGVGCSPSLAEAYANAYATDTKSAFGGIVCLNRAVDAETAKLIDAIFTEVIIAPDFPPEILETLKKKKDRRLIRQRKPVTRASTHSLKTVAGGVLVQTIDEKTLNPDALRVVTKRQPSPDEYAAMLFAWRVAKHVKSNAIVYAHSNRTIGIGAGQMSRVDSSRIAAVKAQEAGLSLAGTAVASDAFFPFADGLLAAVSAGATAVIQPGGSVRDTEVIAAADEHNIAMIFTGIRHFRH